MIRPNLIERSSKAAVDDQPFVWGGVAKLLWETVDANANALLLALPVGTGTDVPVLIIGDANAIQADLGFFNGYVMPTLVVLNVARDAYISIDSGDDAAASAKGIYFKAAADEDIEIINISVTGTPRVYWDESEDRIRTTVGITFDAAPVIASLYQAAGGGLLTIPSSGGADTVCLLAATQELDNKTLDSSVGKGTWTASGTWTIPAVTLGGDIGIGGYALDAGAGSVQLNTTGANVGLKITSTQDGNNGVLIEAYQNSASPVADDALLNITSQGEDAVSAKVPYCKYSHLIESTGDGTHAGKMVWSNRVGAAWNDAMTLSSAGLLAVDVGGTGTPAQVDLFDEYDDALVLRQGIQQNNRELLADMGVLTRKDSGSGYMLNLQPMVRLLAGGIYQSRSLIERLQEKVKELEGKLLLLGAH